ncbi:MAG: tetratricopeptide repeat protein [Polyangiaceae bacterium]|nr:tetratricopeptide repeat protein [Polyangiaceae bacterium]
MLAVLLPVTALALSPVLFAGFVRLDDYSHLFDNPQLRRMSVAGLAAFWTKPYFNLYIPITYSVWWAVTMVGSLFGTLHENAWLFHTLNLAVHLANTALVFLLVRILLEVRRKNEATQGDAADPAIALISALFFAIHPVQVETVAWVSELKGALAAMFGLLGLWWHYRSTGRVLTAACFVAAMLSKPSAIVFPAIVLLVDRVVLGLSLRKSAVMPAVYGLLVLPLLLVTKHLQPNADLNFIPTASQRLGVAADAFAFYLYKVLVPYPLAVDYGLSPRYVLSRISGWQLAIEGVLLVAGVAVVVRSLVRPGSSSADAGGYGLVSCGWAIFLVSIAPVLGFVPFGFQDISTVADHYLYVPMLGVSVMVAGILIHFHAFAGSYRATVAVLVVLAGLSFQQARLWRSTESLFARTLEVNPRSFLAYYCIAQEHMQARRLDEALEWLTKSLTFNPDYLNADIALGLVWAQKGDRAKAIEHYRSVLAKHPSTVGTRARSVSSIHNNLGLLLLRFGFEAEAVEHFREAVRLFPRSLNAHLNLGNVAFSHGRYSDAIAEYQIALSLSPGTRGIEQRLERARQSARAQRASP